MRNALAFTMIVLLAFAGGCKQDNDRSATVASGEPAQAATQASHELTPEQLGELGAQIRKAPDRAGELLSKHGLTEQTFEAQIRKVTENADAARRYAEAYRKASA